MDIKRKLELVEMSVKSIAHHDDAPAGEVEKALKESIAISEKYLKDLTSGRETRLKERKDFHAAKTAKAEKLKKIKEKPETVN